ncbi:MAG: HNH endonuclease signature motif containing protein [Candidatus Eremiobacteraeota bacterium]|nr:HNH endonuclease signature motif containing protein [Candidatus Eremiobacteraeota bacterium]
MDTFGLCQTHTLFLPDEEELLHLNDSFSSQDYEDMLLLPEPYELPAEAYHKAERMVKIAIDGLLPEVEKLTEGFTWGPLPSLIDRDDRASRMDFTLCKAIRGRLALDLVLGGLLVTLKTKGVDHLGYRSMASFAVEHLSMSARRASELMHNYELLSRLPLTREAYLQGKIVKSSLRHLSRIITPENEAEWLEKAQRMTVSGVEREVKKALAGEMEPAVGEERGGGDCAEGLMMHFRVSPSLALTWDFALTFYRDKEHYDGPLADFVEALLGNFLASGKSALQATAIDGKGALPLFYREPFLSRRERECRGSDEELLREMGAPDQASGSNDPWESPWDIFFPSWLDGDSAASGTGPEVVSARSLARVLIKGAMIRQRLDAATGMLFRGMSEAFLHERFGFSSVEDYAETRCGFSRAQTRQFIRLAESLRRRPLTEDAFKKGIITREQARLILPLVDSKNEAQWIAYAASVPTADLREEAGRIARIKEYDCFVPVNYTLLPGFRYFTDERFHRLPEEVQDIIRTGSWYAGPSLAPSWPLTEDDEASLEFRDRRFEKPWRHFSDVNELRAAESSMVVENFSSLCARHGLDTGTTPCTCGTDSLCEGHEALRQARHLCTLPPGESPEETFLRDILQGGSTSRSTSGSMIVKFYLPWELHELWNTANLAFLASQEHSEAAVTTDDAQEGVSADERFLAALLADYLSTEGHFQKAAHHHRILKRDRFRCQVPGCRCRRNLHVHHIIRRSQGGTDDPWNLIVVCEAHHLHILHNLMTLTIKGEAPHNLTFTFGAYSEGTPFLIYEKGVKSMPPHECHQSLCDELLCSIGFSGK